VKHLLIVTCLSLAACSGLRQDLVLLNVCRAHDAAVRALIPQVAAGVPSQSQVNAIEFSMDIADQVCDGTTTDMTQALDLMEGEMLRLRTIRHTTDGIEPEVTL
jgi:hypothetical protein